MFAEHERSLHSRFTDTFLPFSINWRLFYRLNRFMGRRLWRRALDRMYDMSRWNLSDQLMREYRTECLQRMIDVVSNQNRAAVLHEDPNGNIALLTAGPAPSASPDGAVRLISPHIMYEAAVSHAPVATGVLIAGWLSGDAGRPTRGGSLGLFHCP